MSVTESQAPLPTPPKGMDITIAHHWFNPENKHYEPKVLAHPLNANLVVPAVAGNLIAGITAANPVWLYLIILANTGALIETVTLTEPGGNTLILHVPGNTTLVVQSANPDQPLFRSTAAGNMTIVGTIGAVTYCTVAYFVK